MTVTIKVMIPAKIAEASQTTQYTVNVVKAIIDKFDATNFSTAAATISVNLVTFSGSPGNLNVMPKDKILQAGETYTFPEIVGFALNAGDFISTLASVASSINIRASGREIT
jgi:hypothetical protein